MAWLHPSCAGKYQPGPGLAWNICVGVWPAPPPPPLNTDNDTESRLNWDTESAPAPLLAAKGEQAGRGKAHLEAGKQVLHSACARGGGMHSTGAATAHDLSVRPALLCSTVRPGWPGGGTLSNSSWIARSQLSKG